MKVWITKYALSEGIIEIEGEISAANPRIVKIQREGETPKIGQEPCGMPKLTH